MVIFYGIELDIEKSISPNKDDALIVVDMQYDFLPGGSLAVDEGDLIIKGINNIIKLFTEKTIILSQDWHPPDHLSFAKNHPGKNSGDEFQTLDGAIGPVLWPDHCVQNTKGAKFHRELILKKDYKIIQKGMNPKIDSYSVFLENDKKTETELRKYLIEKGIKRIFICGLALDYCVYNTAVDGMEFDFETYVIIDLSRGVDLPPGNIVQTIKNMSEKGVKFSIQESF